MTTKWVSGLFSSLLLACACVPLSLYAAASTNNLSQGQTGLISFDSFNTRGYRQLVRQRFDTTPVQIQGTLSFPPGVVGTTTRVPVVVLAHGSSGLNDNNPFFRWAADLNELGIAAFVLDSFTTRGGPSPSISRANRAIDGVKALQLLSTHPNIDRDRIAIMGFSQGGAMALNMAFEEIRTIFVSDNLKYAAHIMMYSICDLRELSPNMTGSPMLFLHGELDEFDDVRQCENFSQIIRGNGVDVTMAVYPDSHHGFDYDGGVSFNPGWVGLKGCMGQFNLATQEFSRFDTGEVFATGSEYSAYIQSCSPVGLNAGGDEFGRTQSLVDIRAFLGRVFDMPQILPPAQPDRIFNWAESLFPQFIAPSRPASKYFAGYYYRYYPDTNAYLGIKDGRAYYFAPDLNPDLLDVGAEADLLDLATGDGF